MENPITQNTNIKAVRLPMLATLFGAYGMVIEKFKEFFILGSIYAVILAAVYIICGMEALCGNPLYREGHFCSDSLALFAVIHIVNFFVLCMFMRAWHQVIRTGNFKLTRDVFIPGRAELKIIGVSMFYVLAFMIALLAAYLLYVRVPNPNWKIELAYFTAVAWGLLVPLAALRFLCWYAFAAGNEKFPSLKIVWKKTSGNWFLIMSAMVLMSVIGLSLSMAISRNYLANDNFDRLYVVFVGEYLTQMVSLFMAACFISLCSLQKKFLFDERTENGKSGN